MNEFNLALGLLDYLVPIIYFAFGIVAFKFIKRRVKPGFYVLYLIFTILSCIAGLTMPTVKVLIGLKLMPEAVPADKILLLGVFIVNASILCSGTVLLLSTYRLALNWTLFSFSPIFFLPLLAKTSSNINMIAVMLGLIGYILIFISIIRFCKKYSINTPLIFVGLSCLLLVFLASVGIFADVYQAYVHWIIEITNILAQSCSLIAMSILLKKVYLDYKNK